MALKTSGEKVVAKLEWVAEKLADIVETSSYDPIQTSEMEACLWDTIDKIKSWMRAGSQPTLQVEKERAEERGFSEEFLRWQACNIVQNRHTEALIQQGYSSKRASARIRREMLGGAFEKEIQEETGKLYQIAGRIK